MKVYYQPVVRTELPSMAFDHLYMIEAEHGNILTKEQIPHLYKDSEGCDLEPNPYLEIIEAIREHKEIHIWGEWV